MSHRARPFEQKQADHVRVIGPSNERLERRLDGYGRRSTAGDFWRLSVRLAGAGDREGLVVSAAELDHVRHLATEELTEAKRRHRLGGIVEVGTELDSDGLIARVRSDRGIVGAVARG